MNKIFMYARLCSKKVTCAVLKKLQNFRRVTRKFLLCKFRQCGDYYEQSKPSSTQEARVALGYCLKQLSRFFCAPFLRASITRYTHAKHEPTRNCRIAGH